MRIEREATIPAMRKRCEARLLMLRIYPDGADSFTVDLPLEHARNEPMLRQYVQAWRSIAKAHSAMKDRSQ